MNALSTIPLNLAEVDLIEAWSKADPSERVRFTFVVNAETGADRCALAYAELSPGGAIPRHSDDADEFTVVLSGEVDVEIDGESTTAAEGSLLHFPAGVKHRIGNSREQTVRLVLFFDRPSHPVSFDEPLMPMDVVVLGE
jgi:quercetin dioxygenase-like cupin family protein